MWINSKLMLDEKGNIKQAWNFDKKDDDKEEKEKDSEKDSGEEKKANIEWPVNLNRKMEEEKDEDSDKEYIDKLKEKKKRNPQYQLNESAYAELESFVNKIATEKGIDNVSEISINLNREAGIIQFKISEELVDLGKPENDEKDLRNLDNAITRNPEADSDVTESKQV
jgi:hypothetical protein